MDLGTQMSLLLGPSVAVPAPGFIAEALESVEVKIADKGRSGFQIMFKVGRSGPGDLLDYAILKSPLLKAHVRAIIVLIMGGKPKVLMDGIITHQQHNPGSAPGTATLTITGEDISVMLDKEEKSEEHPAQNEMAIANKIILSYSQYGLIPMVIPPKAFDMPLPTDRIPVQQGTDLAYLTKIAKRHGYVFYISPGPVPMTNTAYWGPPVSTAPPQRALTMNMGAETNVDSINFKYNALAPTRVEGHVQDRETNSQSPVNTYSSTSIPLAAKPESVTNAANLRVKKLRASGLTMAQATARAQAILDASTGEVVVGNGDLDGLRYGDLLTTRGIVGLRGAGFTYDGLYYVKSVTHRIKRGEYKQQFTITREGLGAITPVVLP
ncbi:MAG: hypothetical protein IIA59_09355 [Candidatus Marinimicrobia bacterium]|nr:hypothetical protein [Candidatus Neomarinimicrobiota bacterium]